MKIISAPRWPGNFKPQDEAVVGGAAALTAGAIAWLIFAPPPLKPAFVLFSEPVDDGVENLSIINR